MALIAGGVIVLAFCESGAVVAVLAAAVGVVATGVLNDRDAMDAIGAVDFVPN